MSDLGVLWDDASTSTAVIAAGETIADTMSEGIQALVESVHRLRHEVANTARDALAPYEALREATNRCCDTRDRSAVFDAAWRLAPHVADGAYPAEVVARRLLDIVRDDADLGEMGRAVAQGLAAGLRHHKRGRR